MRHTIAFIAAALLAVSFVTPAPAQVIYDDANSIAAMYQRYLGRNPDATGLQGWVQEARRGRNIQAVILGSDEYYLRRGSTPQGFITGLYVDVLGRVPAANEVQGWLDRLPAIGYNREALAAEFVNAAAYE